MTLLAQRDKELSQIDPKRKRSHFFKSFFVSKVLNEGNTDPDVAGQYEYRHVREWSRRAPGMYYYVLLPKYPNIRPSSLQERSVSQSLFFFTRLLSFC